MADSEIPALTADAGPYSGTELFHIVDSDGNSRKLTLAELKTYINTNPTIVPSSEPWRGARAYRTADLSIANNTQVIVTWQAEDLDTDAMWSGGAPTRMTAPADATKVRATANIRWAANATGPRFAYFLKNGAAFRGAGMSVIGADTSTGHSQNIVSAVIPVTPGASDYFEVAVFQTSGGALNLDGLTRQEHNWFQLEVVEG